MNSPGFLLLLFFFTFYCNLSYGQAPENPPASDIQQIFPATMLAATNHPAKLILQAPYYSLSDAIHYLYPAVDTTEMPFQFNTYQYLPKVYCPVVIFHGDSDKTFYYGSSQKLSAFFKTGDKLITLKGAGHDDMEKNKDYLIALKNILQK